MKKTTLIALIFYYLSISFGSGFNNEDNCGQRASSLPVSRIVNGTATTPGRWPWQAMILQRDGDRAWFGPVCGGTLIRKQWVLTAAHCSDGYPYHHFHVVLGTIYRNDTDLPNKTYAVSFMHCHKDYNNFTLENDICLFKLASEVEYTSYIRPACLPIESEDLYIGQKCSITGWGDTLGTGSRNVLREAEVEIINKTLCEQWYDEDGLSIPEDHICAGYEEGLIDSCQGDSGGPLLCKEEQIDSSSYVIRGITSFGIGCAWRRRPGVYTSVEEYLEWIKNTITYNSDNCGQRASSFPVSRIVNGTATTPGRWPWQAMILRRDGDQAWFGQVCGGTLIRKQWVLTAAHCSDGYPYHQFHVVLGTIYLNDTDLPNKTYAVSSMHCHKDYNNLTPENDICLFKLASEVEYTSYIRPVCLPMESEDLYIGQKCSITGWGDTLGTGSRNVLREAEVEIINKTLCEQWYDEDGLSIPEDHICAGYEEGLIDSCQGDSGGPLLCKEEQIDSSSYVIRGITSFGIGCAWRRRPGVYTSVEEYLEWIKNTITYNSGIDMCFSHVGMVPEGSTITVNNTILRPTIQNTRNWFYTSNTDSTWKIQAPTNSTIVIEFICFFTLEETDEPSCLDFIEISSNTTVFNRSKICGIYLPAPIRIKSNMATVRFHSDVNIESLGFVMKITFLVSTDSSTEYQTTTEIMNDFTTDPTQDTAIHSTTAGRYTTPVQTSHFSTPVNHAAVLTSTFKSLLKTSTAYSGTDNTASTQTINTENLTSTFSTTSVADDQLETTYFGSTKIIATTNDSKTILRQSSNFALLCIVLHLCANVF